MSEISNTPLPPNKTSGRKILLILAVIFVLPFTVAATLHLLNLKPSGKSYGTLVQPPQALTFPVLHDAQGKEFKPQQWLKIWSIVIVDSSGCVEPCQTQAHILKQVHILLNKDAHRLQRVLLVPAELKAETATALQKQYPDLLILAGTDAEMLKFSAKFNSATSGVYLVDPFGNLMMSYPEKIDPKGLFGDLKRLIKNTMAG